MKMTSASQHFGNLMAGTGNLIFQGIGNTHSTSALERKQFLHGNPPPLNRNFLGREYEIAAIKAAFQQAETGKQKRYVIYGMGGIGKSEICVKLRNDMQNEFWGLFWVDVSDPMSAEGDFKRIADQIRPGTTHETLGDALSALAEVNLNTHPWLLILDNADDLKEDYARFFPSAPRGSILMTSRNHECAVHETVGSCELESISFQDSVLLLFKAAKLDRNDWESHRPHAETITELLGSHTLALIQAGAYISRSFRNWTEYPRVLKENRQRLFTTRLNQAQSKHGNIYATLEASALALDSDGSTQAKDALCLLGILAMLHHSAFPTSIFEHALIGLNYVAIYGYGDNIDEISTGLKDFLPAFLLERSSSTSHFEAPLDRLEEALYRLEALSFIKQTSIDNSDGAKLVSIHPLAHFWAKDRLNETQQERAWMMAGSIIALAAKSDLQYLSRPDYAHWNLDIRQLQYHIITFLDNRAACSPPHAWVAAHLQVHYAVARILSTFELHERLTSFLLEVFKMLEAEPAKLESGIFLPFYEVTAASLYQLGEYQSSFNLFQQIICLQEANSFSEENLLRSKLYLAITSLDTGEMGENIQTFESILARAKKVLSAGDVALYASQKALGRAYLQSGETEKGIGLLEQVVQIEQKMLGERSLKLVISREELGNAYLENGQAKKAVKVLTQVVRVRQKKQVENSPARLQSEHQLGCAHRENGQAKEAVELLEHVFRVRQKYNMESSQKRLGSEHDLARAYDEAMRYQEALVLFEHVATVERTTLSLDDASRLLTLAFLPNAYIRNGQPEKAEEVVVEFDNALRGLSKDDPQWREHQEWLASWKQYFGMEEESQILDECNPCV